MTRLHHRAINVTVGRRRDRQTSRSLAPASISSAAASRTRSPACPPCSDKPAAVGQPHDPGHTQHASRHQRQSPNLRL